MKNILQLSAVIQIVAAFAFVYYAQKINPGISEMCRKFSTSCSKAEKSVNAHKEAYRKSAENIISLKNALSSTGDQTLVTSEKLLKWGNYFKNTSKRNKLIGKALQPIGASLAELGVNTGDISTVLKQQADILYYYENKTLPETMETFDSTAAALAETQAVLEKLEIKSESNIRILSYLAGLIFLLNGFSFILIARLTPTSGKKE